MEIVSARSKEHFSIASRLHADSWRYAYRGMISDDYLDSLKDDFWTSTLERLSNLYVLDMDILFDNCNATGAFQKRFWKHTAETLRQWAQVQGI